MAEFAADLVLVDTGFDSPLKDHALFQAMAAVKAGQVIELDETMGGIHFPAMLALTRYFAGQVSAMLPLHTDLVT